MLPHLSSGVTDSTRALWRGFSEDGPWKELIVCAQRQSQWRCISVSDDHKEVEVEDTAPEAALSWFPYQVCGMWWGQLGVKEWGPGLPC